jgi:two-component system LytT family sensor kinase
VWVAMIFYAYAYEQRVTSFLLKKTTIVPISGIIATHLLREVITRYSWLLQPIEKQLPRLLVAVVVSSVFCSLIHVGVEELFDLGIRKLDFTTRLLAQSENNGVFMIPWLLIYYSYHYFEKLRRQQERTLKLKALVKELELKTIQLDVNPHFIFNALNSIRTQIDENPSRARKGITELSKILRTPFPTQRK